jgi:hypothetical protein
VADSAELEVLLHALATGYFEHRERCALCAGDLPCAHVQRAIGEVISWREARLLLSSAEALRAEALASLARHDLDAIRERLDLEPPAPTPRAA